MPDLSALAAEVDQLLRDRAIVFGSLPSSARDLDLLVRTPDPTLPERMRAAGFAEWGTALWVRVADGQTQVVELVDSAQWRLPPAAVADLFAKARPLPGRHHLAEPAPSHLLLVLARRLVPAGGAPSPAKLARIDRALTEDPTAARAAAADAEAWGCAKELAVLLDVHRRTRAVRRREVWPARIAEQRRRGRSTPRAVAEVVAARFRRSPAAGLVVLTGPPDACGAQVERLTAGLRVLGDDDLAVVRADAGTPAGRVLASYAIDPAQPPDEVTAHVLRDVWARRSRQEPAG